MAGEKEMIDPSGIPHFIGDLDALGTDVMLLTANAAQLRASGSDVHTTFQHLSAFYKAPEAEQLFATTLPVQQKSDAFADDLEKVAYALLDYSLEVEPLVKRIDTLKAEATAFVNSVAGDDDWKTDQGKIDHNLELWQGVNHTMAAFQAAERRAYNKIMALIGGDLLTVDDGSHGENTYGYKADDLDHAESTPWGAPAEREYEGLDWVGHQLKGVWDGFVIDGVGGTIKGLGTLVGTDGWDAAGDAWTNLGKLGTGLVITIIPFVGEAFWMVSDDKLPSWLRDSRTAMKETGKALVAYDTWKTNPARASGAVLFNGLTAVFTGGSGGAAASGASKASAAVRTVSAVSKFSRAIDPMTYVGKAGKFTFTKVGDTFTTLKNLHTGATADLLKQAEALRSPKIPDTAVPYVDATGKVVYLTHEGNVLNIDGSLRQHANEAAHELSTKDHQELGGPRLADHSSDLVGAGARAEHTPDPSHTSEQAPGQTGRSDGNHAALREEPSTRSAGAESSDRPGVGGGTAGHTSPGVGPASGIRDPESGLPHELGTGENLPGQRPAEVHPVGQDWYDQLDPHQVKDVQVYRANHEPGYFEKYYRDNGRRHRIAIRDESEYPPPHLKKDPNHPGTWIAATDKQPPFSEKYVPRSKVVRGPDTVPDGGIESISKSASQRHLSIQADNVWHEPIKAAKRAYLSNSTFDNLQAYEAIKAEHAPFHRRMSLDSEAFGEAVTRHHVVPLHYKGYEWEDLSGPKNGNDRFDQAWSRTDKGFKKFTVFEIKGSHKLGLGKRELPSGFDARQGSIEYFNDILEQMRKRGVNGDDREMRLYLEIKRALRRGNVEYVLVKAKTTASGDYAGYVKWSFDIR
ncbi:hypothetical protein AB0L85_00915 [Streptomyces sp. NPDC052051]|uniref:hypothetical protein n=1 Tax=Streptomyces sp. NPDC052051 TaxID=3154649 RepID=UPI00343B525F